LTLLLCSPLCACTLLKKQMQYGGHTFVIVVSQDATWPERSLAGKVRELFQEHWQYEPVIVTDDMAEAKYEVVIGQTNREDSTRIYKELAEKQCACVTTDTKLILEARDFSGWKTLEQDADKLFKNGGKALYTKETDLFAESKQTLHVLFVGSSPVYTCYLPAQLTALSNLADGGIFQCDQMFSAQDAEEKDLAELYDITKTREISKDWYAQWDYVVYTQTASLEPDSKENVEQFQKLFTNAEAILNMTYDDISQPQGEEYLDMSRNATTCMLSPGGYVLQTLMDGVQYPSSKKDTSSLLWQKNGGMSKYAGYIMTLTLYARLTGTAPEDLPYEQVEQNEYDSTSPGNSFTPSAEQLTAVQKTVANTLEEYKQY